MGIVKNKKNEKYKKETDFNLNLNCNIGIRRRSAIKNQITK